VEERIGFIKRNLHHLLALDPADRAIQVEPIPLTVEGLPPAFHLARVAVVADIHLPQKLVSVKRLLRALTLQKPDAILIPGDLTNSYTDFDATGLRQLADALVAVAPCFAVAGNHEWRDGREPLYRQILTEAGVQYMCDSYAVWEKNGAALTLYGMGKKKPAPLMVNNQPSVALAHHPELMPYYKQAGWNVVICGHAHGGHARLGQAALFAPGQGFFPKYTAGVHTEGDTRMIISRGLGNSSIPWRVGNPPHLPVIILSAKEK